jgi:hypothetical protein
MAEQKTENLITIGQIIPDATHQCATGKPGGCPVTGVAVTGAANNQ